ncbi:fibronectin type III domain-containing protein [Candidatus Uhrbacteria bacterium]|nr:fibronectin type III domain-containing protein [Candidatus Uhrbacteria bacterium]
MGKSASGLSKIFNDPQQKRRWQGGLGLLVFALFVLSSVVVSRTVQALNLAAGNYGYYGGTYGYNASTTSSDAPPAAPTALTTSSGTTTSVSLSWTAPTLTTLGTAISTGSGSIGRYLINYSTSSLSDCSGGTSTESTSASISLTGLTAGTTYYVGICAEDNNLNNSTALTGSFTTQSSGGGTSSVASGGGGAVSTGPTYPTGAVTAAPAAAAPAAPVAVGVLSDAAQLAAQIGVARDTAAEASSSTKVSSSASEFGLTLAAAQVTQATNFVTYGISIATQKLGSGERLALVRDAFDTLGRFPNNPTAFFEEVATGKKPSERNLTKEVGQAGVARDRYWRQITGRSAPNFKVAADDLAWNTLLYRIRFERNLDKERIGIGKFRTVFKRLPASPIDWAAVKAWGYVLAPR